MITCNPPEEGTVKQASTIPNLKGARPFLKWAGGKTQLLPELVRRMPRFSGRYFEPFLGGGALFFHLAPEQAVIRDTNREIINCCRVIRDKVDALIERLSSMRYDKDEYYRIRAEDPEDMSSPVDRAARTIYLNRTGFNGLYRVNSNGKFNVPMGRYKNPTICDEKNLKACAVTLSKADIEVASFETVADAATPEDFVYLDPPYIPVSKTAHFTAYQQGGFSMGDQAKLAETFEALTRKGVPCMLSNSDVPWINEAYREYRIRRVKAVRAVNSKASARGAVSEVIVTNYEFQ